MGPTTLDKTTLFFPPTALHTSALCLKKKKNRHARSIILSLKPISPQNVIWSGKKPFITYAVKRHIIYNKIKEVLNTSKVTGDWKANALTRVLERLWNASQTSPKSGSAAALKKRHTLKTTTKSKLKAKCSAWTLHTPQYIDWAKVLCTHYKQMKVTVKGHQQQRDGWWTRITQLLRHFQDGI